MYHSYLKVVSELVKSGKPRVRRAHYQRRRIGDAEASPDGLQDDLDGVGHEERRDHDDVEDPGGPRVRLRRQPRRKPGRDGGRGRAAAAAALVGVRGGSHLQEKAGEGRARRRSGGGTMGIWSGVKKMENVENDRQVDEESGVDSDSEVLFKEEGTGCQSNRWRTLTGAQPGNNLVCTLHCPNALWAGLWPLLGTAIASRYCLCYLTFLTLRLESVGLRLLDHSYSWGRFQDEYYIFN